MLGETVDGIDYLGGIDSGVHLEELGYLELDRRIQGDVTRGLYRIAAVLPGSEFLHRHPGAVPRKDEDIMLEVLPAMLVIEGHYRTVDIVEGLVNIQVGKITSDVDG